ncbi:START domain-containing protein [Vibrio sinaloensis]|uniref:START domain-containing protein n=1 Tax=Photobacterium sp. (strain ATCC 43367) TaxID=379097 RepID=UPI002F3E4066
MNKPLCSLALSALIVSAHSLASSNLYWQFEGDSEGISVYSREHTDGLVEIKTQMFTPTSYGAFLTLLEDSENIPNWVDNVSSSRVLNQLSTTENIVYTQFSAPWPAKDRDMVTYSRYTQDELGFTLTITDEPPATFPLQEGYIRIESVNAQWQLQKLTSGTTLIEYTAFADPGGALPNWLINKLAKESARKTFENLKAQLPRYQAFQHPNVEESPKQSAVLE